MTDATANRGHGEVPAPIPPPSPAARRKVLSRGQAIICVALAVVLAASVVAFGAAALVALSAMLTAFFVAANVAKLDLIRRGANARRAQASAPDLPARVRAEELPVYTILLPLYREDAILGQLIDGILALDYPPAKLDVKLLLEKDDDTTRQAVGAMTLPECFETVIVSGSGPTGKPRACNAGLARATGDYLVIYDAEDRPEPDQLRKAVAGFTGAPPDVVCLQAKLNYFNRTHNLLTRWFTAEYSLWFDQLLPGLQAMDVAIPLGGTSNHFRIANLRELGGWDAFNVTEDADLGLRIYTTGWKTAVLESTTYEEATSRWHNWIRQRSRWIKGYMQTYLWHMRDPRLTWRRMGPRAFAMLQLFFGAATLCVIINPIYWALTALWFAEHYHFINVLFPSVLLYLGIVGLFVGNAAFVMSAVSGAYGRKNYEDVKWVLLVPVYWLLMSLAAWKALIQLCHKPFYWEKTVHGHCVYSPQAGIATEGDAHA
jgi:cellulose synthase/poly-beta-1,6-N-acetylglucosamine synthase-like glycosyltransferase